MEDRFIAAFTHAVSPTRMAKYDEYSWRSGRSPLDLYLLNMRYSSELVLCLALVEVVLRNHVDRFLRWRFGGNWPDSEPLHRILKDRQARVLDDALERQQRIRNPAPLSTDNVVGDLPFGFWVALFATDYRVPFGWWPDHNLRRVLPNRPGSSLGQLHADLDGLRQLRNRIAHHEPILHLDLPRLHETALMLIGSMCSDTREFVLRHCRFRDAWGDGPGRIQLQRPGAPLQPPSLTP